MIQVFVTTVATDPDDPRLHLARAVYHWWQRQPGCHVTMQNLAGVEASQRFRHVLAYHASDPAAPYYILTDDDILPFPTCADGRPWRDGILGYLDAHPDIGMATPFLLNENDVPRAMPESMVHRALGGCRVFRRSAVAQMVATVGFPALRLDRHGKYDDTLCTALATASRGHVTVYTPWWAKNCGQEMSTYSR